MMAVIILDRARDGDLGTSVIVRRNHMFRRHLCKNIDVGTAEPVYHHTSCSTLDQKGSCHTIFLTGGDIYIERKMSRRTCQRVAASQIPECSEREAQQHQPLNTNTP